MAYSSSTLSPKAFNGFVDSDTSIKEFKSVDFKFSIALCISI